MIEGVPLELATPQHEEGSAGFAIAVNPLYVVRVWEHPRDAEPGDRELIGDFGSMAEAEEEIGAPTKDDWVHEFLWTPIR